MYPGSGVEFEQSFGQVEFDRLPFLVDVGDKLFDGRNQHFATADSDPEQRILPVDKLFDPVCGTAGPLFVTAGFGMFKPGFGRRFGLG